MRNARLDESQSGIKIAGRTINNLGYTDDVTLMAESEKEPNGLLMKAKEESEKAGLRLNIQRTVGPDDGIRSCHFMANRWGNVETVSDFIWGGSKINVDSDCRHEIKRCLLFGRKAITNLDSILKSRLTLLTKVHIVKTMAFLVVMYGCESWTIKVAEH